MNIDKTKIKKEISEKREKQENNRKKQRKNTNKNGKWVEMRKGKSIKKWQRKKGRI